MSWRVAAVLLVAAGLLLGACGDDGAPDDPADGNGAEVTDVTERPAVSALIAEEADGDPPDTLQIRDVVQGDGDTATAGAVVTVQYVGVSWSTGEEFDASWDHGQPFTFELGAGRVIDGWEQGVGGMRVGGRRVLVIPPDLAYGDSGVPGAIEPGETLVFIVDLVDVE